MAFRLDLTASDLDDIPPDGRKWELLDGVLHVTPSPRADHQYAVTQLCVRLVAAAPPGLVVLVAPMDYRPSSTTNVQPDLLVVSRASLHQPRIVETPSLVVEVLSPSTRADDLGSKRIIYERLGVPAYWVVDADARTLTVFASGVPPAEYGPGGVAELTAPFPVAVELDGLRA